MPANTFPVPALLQLDQLHPPHAETIDCQLTQPLLISQLTKLPLGSILSISRCLRPRDQRTTRLRASLATPPKLSPQNRSRTRRYHQSAHYTYAFVPSECYLPWSPSRHSGCVRLGYNSYLRLQDQGPAGREDRGPRPPSTHHAAYGRRQERIHCGHVRSLLESERGAHALASRAGHRYSTFSHPRPPRHRLHVR